MARVALKTLTDEQINRIKAVILRVWSQIGADMRVTSNVEAIETCLDADRPETFCGAEGKEVQELLKNLEETPTQVDRFLAKRIQLAA